MESSVFDRRVTPNDYLVIKTQLLRRISSGSFAYEGFRGDRSNVGICSHLNFEQSNSFDWHKIGPYARLVDEEVTN